MALLCHFNPDGRFLVLLQRKGPSRSNATLRENMRHVEVFSLADLARSGVPVLLSIVTVRVSDWCSQYPPVDAPTRSRPISAATRWQPSRLLLSVASHSRCCRGGRVSWILQKPLEESYGLIPALTLTGLAFGLRTRQQGSAKSPSPFHMVASVLLGLSAYLTRSLLPAIIGHALRWLCCSPHTRFTTPAVHWSFLGRKAALGDVPPRHEWVKSCRSYCGQWVYPKFRSRSDRVFVSSLGCSGQRLLTSGCTCQARQCRP